MGRGKGDSSSDADPTPLRRFYEFWTSRPGVLIVIAVVLGTIVALLTATVFSDDDNSGGATSPIRYPPKGIARCSDGRDNDRDAKTDFGADPGCSSATDISEKAGAAACSDGRDNDGDGKTDFGPDPGCSSATDPAEKK